MRTALCLVWLLGMAVPQPAGTAELEASPIELQAIRVAEAEPSGLAGAPDRLEDILPAGAPLIVHFWATWCVPCRGELPELAEFRQALPPELSARLVVVSVDKRPRVQVRRFLESDIDLPEFQTYLIDPAEAGSRFQIIGYPLTLFLSPDGTVARRISGAAPWPDKAFRRQVLEHLSASPKGI
ncbi:MAG: TlpA disulfide reductase family protein [Hoeflea sp.]|nr:TlpA disulfide reductase family protein [Hoeflea sp.]